MTGLHDLDFDSFIFGLLNLCTCCLDRLLLCVALRTFANVVVSLLLHFVLPAMSMSYRAVENIK